MQPLRGRATALNAACSTTATAVVMDGESSSPGERINSRGWAAMQPLRGRATALNAACSTTATAVVMDGESSSPGERINSRGWAAMQPLRGRATALNAACSTAATAVVMGSAVSRLDESLLPKIDHKKPAAAQVHCGLKKNQTRVRDGRLLGEDLLDVRHVRFSSTAAIAGFLN
jgi:hypothetical protein